MKLLNVCSASSILIAALLAVRAEAHNGAVALAYPVEGITVDGDFSDWPEDLRRYPIALAEYGVPPEDASDFEGFFRIGYDAGKNVLYLAVEVRDESTVLDPADPVGWSTQDGCEVYVDLGHGEEHSIAVQYAIYGDHRTGSSVQGEKVVERAWQREEGLHRYEWGFHVEGMHPQEVVLKPGMTAGVDVVVCDKDADGSYSWIAWGKGSNKFESVDRRGDVALMEGGEDTGRIWGRVTWEATEEGIRNRSVRIQSVHSEALSVKVETDREGGYVVELPLGAYSVEAERVGAQRVGRAVELKKGERIDVSLSLPRMTGRKVPAGSGRSVQAGAGFRQGVWHTFSMWDGLESDAVACLLQDRVGVLWIGTRGGLSRYNGKTFTTFTIEDGLPVNTVSALLEDEEGSLWIGTRGGLSRYDGGTFTTFTIEDGLPHNHVRALLEDGAGGIWIGTEEGLSRYEEDMFTTFTIKDGLPNNNVRALVEDGAGGIWIGTNGGLSRYDGGTFTSFTVEDGLPHNAVLALLEDEEGGLWIGTSGGLSRYDGDTLTPFTVEDGLPHNSVQALLEDGAGGMWIGTEGGLSRYDGVWGWRSASDWWI